MMRAELGHDVDCDDGDVPAHSWLEEKERHACALMDVMNCTI